MSICFSIICCLPNAEPERYSVCTNLNLPNMYLVVVHSFFYFRRSLCVVYVALTYVRNLSGSYKPSVCVYFFSFVLLCRRIEFTVVSTVCVFLYLFFLSFLRFISSKYIFAWLVLLHFMYANTFIRLKHANLIFFLCMIIITTLPCFANHSNDVFFLLSFVHFSLDLSCFVLRFIFFCSFNLTTEEWDRQIFGFGMQDRHCSWLRFFVSFLVGFGYFFHGMCVLFCYGFLSNPM